MFLNFLGHRMCKMRTVNVCKGKFDIFKNNKAICIRQAIEKKRMSFKKMFYFMIVCNFIFNFSLCIIVLHLHKSSLFFIMLKNLTNMQLWLKMQFLY